MEKDFTNTKLTRRTINYPAYQTTHRFRQLYSDIRTFARELIQNADDAGAKSIVFNMKLPEKIEVFNDGKTFDSDDIDRLLTPSKGGKAFDLTGAMNIGALSVLSITDEPWYHSGNIVLKFEMDHVGEDFVPYINENFEKSYNGTKILLPLHNKITQDDIEKLNNIDEYLIKFSHLLFTQNLKKIVLEYPNREIHLNRENIEEEHSNIKHTNIKIEKRCLINTSSLEKRSEKTNWVIFRRNIKVPKRYFTEKELKRIGKEIEYPIDFAFMVNNKEVFYPIRLEYPIYIIFPSDTPFGLGFVLSSNFRPDTSRKGFATEGIDGEFNKFLLTKASQMLETILEYFKNLIDSYPINERIIIFDELIKVFYLREVFSPLEQHIKRYIHKSIINLLKKNLLGNDGEWHHSSQVYLAKKEIWAFLNNDIKFMELPKNENIMSFLKLIGLRELSFKDLLKRFSHGDIHPDLLLKAFNILLKHKEEISGRSIALFLLDWLTKNNKNILKKDLQSLLDKIYSYLGNSEVYKWLPVGIKARLNEEPIIYITSLDKFQIGSQTMFYTKEAERIFGNDKDFIQNRDYPNSLTFFREIGVKTSINTNDLAEYLIEYIKEQKVQIKRLIMLYSVIGERYKYLGNKQKSLLQTSKIILTSDQKSFEIPRNLIIPDDKKLTEMFPSIKKAYIDKKVIKFLEKLGVKKISEIITKRVIISGVITEDQNTKNIKSEIRKIIPYIEAITEEININLDNDWKRRLYGIKCVNCEKIFYELQYKDKKKKIQGNSVDFNEFRKTLGIEKNIRIRNYSKFLLDLSKALSMIIFKNHNSNVKLMAPLIEKFLQSENKLNMMEELGFSTLLLEAKGHRGIDKTIIVPKFNEEGPLEMNEKNIKNYYEISNSVKNILQNKKKILYRSLEFPQSFVPGNPEYKSAIPKLKIKKKNDFHYYLQENLKIVVPITDLKKFERIIRFIITQLEGNPETVAIGVFNTPIHAFNFNGQLIFNYLMLKDKSLEEEIPLYLIWIMIAAHEIAHNVSQYHDQLHSKFTMIFSVRALKKLKEIEKEYRKIYG